MQQYQTNLLKQIDKVLSQCNSGRQIDSNRARDMFLWLSIGLQSFVISIPVQVPQINFESIDLRETQKNDVDNELNRARQMIKALKDEVKEITEKHSLQIDKKVSLSDLQQSIPKVDQKINELKNDINALSLRLTEVENKLSEILKGQNPKSEVENTRQLLKPPIEAKSWIEPKYQYLHNLFLDGTSIIAKSYVFVFGKNEIVGKYTFNVTFSKIKNVVGLGFIDSLNKDRFKNFNFVRYSNNCFFNVGDFEYYKGRGFKVGERVTINIDLKQGTIQFSVDQQLRCRETVPMLKDNSIIWVPFIQLNSKHDSVEISEE